MNPDVFFQNFELLADAPNGVQKLRELILQLAVMGKLVEQDLNDEPASVLVEKITTEKRKLGKEGKIKGFKPLPEISDNEILFEVPESWKWIRFDDICSHIQRGKSPKYVEESDFPVIAQKCIQWDGLKIDRAKFIDPLTIEKYEEVRFLRTGDLLWNSTGTGTIGRVNVYVHEENTYEKVVADSHVTVVRPLIVDPYYVFCWIATPIVQNNIENIASGSTNQIELATSTAKNHVLPLPPLAEQKRIVSKVDELMSLCDKLEARRQKKQEIQSKLNSAALDKMLSAKNQGEFEQNWQRICENFDLLYDNPENVGKLKQAILQLAVQGKLVEQDSEDEPASFLIEKIEAEEKKLFKEGKIHKAKNLQAVDVEEIPYNIPNGWLWIRFGKIASHIEAGWSPMCEKRPKEGEEWGVLKISAVSWDVFNPSENKALPSNLNPRPEYEVKPNDFLMSRANTSELVGKSVIVEDTIPKLMISDKVLRLFFSSYSFKKYYNIFNNSQTARFYYAKEASGTSSSMKNISREVIYNMPVPLPPLNEQKRIVEKVEQLMELCDELELKLRKEREDSGKLMETVVKGLLEGAAAEI